MENKEIFAFYKALYRGRDVVSKEMLEENSGYLYKKTNLRVCFSWGAYYAMYKWHSFPNSILWSHKDFMKLIKFYRTEVIPSVEWNEAFSLMLRFLDPTLYGFFYTGSDCYGQYEWHHIGPKFYEKNFSTFTTFYSRRRGKKDYIKRFCKVLCIIANNLKEARELDSSEAIKEAARRLSNYLTNSNWKSPIRNKIKLSKDIPIEEYKIERYWDDDDDY